MPARVNCGMALWMLLMAVSIGGCNVVRITLDKPITPEDVAFVVPGQTPLREVVSALGAPASIAESSRGVVVTYRFLDMKYSRVNFGWLLRPWTPIDPDLVMSRTGFGVDTYELQCDDQWVVTNHGFIRRQTAPAFNPYPF